MDGVGAAGTIREIADHLLQNWGADHRYLGGLFFYVQAAGTQSILPRAPCRGWDATLSQEGGFLPMDPTDELVKDTDADSLRGFCSNLLSACCVPGGSGCTAWSPCLQGAFSLVEEKGNKQMINKECWK